MRLERFRGASVDEALAAVRRRLGDDALVLSTRGKAGNVEVTATTALDLYQFGAAVRAASRSPSTGRRTRVIALVGPTGSGKTTTAAKLALSDRAFAGGRVALLSLDTYKIGAYEQIQTYADLADLPLDVAGDAREATRALKRMSDCDTVIVDTPGRSPRAEGGDLLWWEALRALEPDEVHLVVPASMRPSLVAGLVRDGFPLPPTHLLVTKLDELPSEAVAAEIAFDLGLPSRWVTDGQSVPDDLASGPDRLVAAVLGGAPPPALAEMVV